MNRHANIDTRFLPLSGQPPVEWARTPGLTAYDDAVAAMERRAEAIRRGEAGERVWLVEHPPLFTAGTSARPEHLLAPDMLPVHDSGRGGQYTYHGPGQRVAYVMLDLSRRRQDVRAFVAALEEWIIRALARFGVRGERDEAGVGIWVRRQPPGGAPRVDKIAAIGIRLRRWVSFHGIAVNLSPDLSHYSGIVACGIADRGVISLADLGIEARMDAFDAALLAEFVELFGPAVETPAPHELEDAT